MGGAVRITGRPFSCAARLHGQAQRAAFLAARKRFVAPRLHPAPRSCFRLGERDYMLRVPRKGVSRALLAGLVCSALAMPAPAYLYWAQPVPKGEPVKGDEPGIAIPLAGATDKELKAGLVWSMRAGLNVAALQCDFSPGLMTAGNYNALIRQHSTELQASYKTLAGYFKRKAGKTDPLIGAGQYDTRTYNSFSTFHAQLTFCDTAASIGREALVTPVGHFADLAANRMREFRNSLVPTKDARLGTSPDELRLAPAPDLACVNAKGRAVKCKT